VPGFFGAPTGAKSEDTTPAKYPAFFDHIPDAPPAPATSKPPEPPSFWDQFKTRVAAGVERVAGAAQEVGGEGGINSSQRIFWQATILPEALRLSKQNGTQLTDDPGVQSAAKLLGLTPVDFVSGADAYARLSPDRIKQVIDGAKGDMSKFGATAASGTAKRAEAGQMEQNYAPGFGEGHGVKNFALQTASLLPDMAVALGLSATGVGALPAAGLLATDFGLRGYSTARDAGLDNQSAMGYGAISGLIASVPEVPVMSVLGKAPGANSILESALGKTLGNSTVGNISRVAVNQTAAGTVQGALQAALDKGTITPNMSLADALRTIRDSAAGGLMLGTPLGAAHVAGHRIANGPAPKLGAEPAPAGAPETANAGQAAPVLRRPQSLAQSNLVSDTYANEDAAASTDLAAELDGHRQQQAAQAREIAQRNAEDHFEPLAAVDQAVAPARRPVVEAGPANAIEHGQADAAAHVAAQGGDALSQVVAATHAGAVLGGVHDAAAVHGAREAEQAANMREMQRQQDVAAQAAPDIHGFDTYEEPAAEQPKSESSVVDRMRAQAGDQSMPGAEKGTAGAALPTLADAMTPEQRQAFATLKTWRNAEAAKPAATENRAAAAPPNRLAAIRAAAEKRQAPAEPAVTPEKAATTTKESAATGEEPLPENGPPAATAQTMAQRRQAALDTQMAEKVRGSAPKAPATAPTRAEVESAAHEAATSPKNELPMPTKAQQDAGNFKSGHTEVAGLPITIEHPEGSTRPSGNTLEGGHYGYIKGTVGADGQHVDTIVGKQPAAKRAWVVDHLDQDGNWQQHKVLLGFNNRLEALRAYRSAFPDAPLGKVSETSTDGLKDWLNTGNTTRPFNPEVAAPTGTLMHGQRPADIAKREAAFNRDTAYKNLMTAKPEDVGSAVGKMTPEEAQSHLDRLNAAPGDNPVARAALEARTASTGEAAEAPPQRKTLTLPGRRARFADSNAQPARAEDQAYTQNDDGTHSVTTPDGGSTAAEDHPNGHDLVVKNNRSARGDRDAGNDTARLERLAQAAHDRGGNLESPARVSEPTQRSYEQLKQRGYPVEERPNQVDPRTGEKASTSANGVYSVGPRDLTKMPGLALKRLAHTGDPAARAETDRRINGGTPEEEGALAARRAEEQTRGTAAPEEGALAARRADAQDNTKPRLTKAQGEAALKPVLDRLPGAEGVTVHESANSDTVPKDIQDAMRPGSRNENAPAAYDTSTDTVHLFADRHSTPEQLQRKAIHEIVGHQGLRRLLGKDFGATMDDIAKKADAQGSAWMKEHAAEKELNLKDPAQARVAADEWAAHLAEFNEDSPGTWQKIVDAVRSGLREIPGIGQHMIWTENDVKALVRKSETGLRTFNPRVRQLQDNMGQVRFAGSDDIVNGDLPPEHPLAINEKLGKLAADQENYNKGTIRSIDDWGRTVEEQMPKGYKESPPAKAKEMLGEAVHAGLGAIPLHNLPDFLNPERTRPLMPSAQRFIDEHDNLDAARGRADTAGGKLADRWQRYNLDQPDGGEKLLDLMHDSTRNRTDPSKEYTPHYGEKRLAADTKAAAFEKERKAEYDNLKDRYQALDPKGKELYGAARDHYTLMRDNEQRALEKRIEDTQASRGIKDKYIALLKKQSDLQRGIEPYFPLSRDGEHWASAKDANGKTIAFARFDSSNKQLAWMAEAQKHGLTTERGRDMDTPGDRRKLDPKFATDVAEMAKDISPEFAEEVWAHYIRSMPEMAGVKKGLPRVGRFGYTQDALHNFKTAVQRNALTVSRLEHGQKLNDLVDKIKSEAAAIQNNPGTTEKDKRYATALAKEFAQRNELITNPHAAGPIASAITKLGYGWYLGWAPATATRILAQNFTLANPRLTKHFGYAKTSAKLTAASARLIAKGGNQRFIDSTRGGLRQMLDKAQDMGLISNTWASTLSSGGPRAPGEAVSTGGTINRGLDTAVKTAGWLFNQTERHNRITTLTSAYELGIDKGMSHEDAERLAFNETRNAHVDYSLADRPRYLQGNDVARVVGQFKLYPADVTYQLLREFRDTTRMDDGVTLEQRAQSAKALTAMLGHAWLLGGITSLPLYWLVAGVANVFHHDVEGDDSYDFTNEMKQHFANMFGKRASDNLVHGPISNESGYNLSSAADYNNLSFHSSDQDKSMYGNLGDAAAQLGGSPAGILGGIAQGIDTATGPNGDVERGFEHALPTQAANILKAIRFYTQGAKNLKGEDIVPREDIRTPQAFFRLLGFNPMSLVEQQETNAAYNNAKERIQTHKQALEDGLEHAINDKDSVRQQEIEARIAKFNEVNAGNPEAIIKTREIGALARRRAKEGATTVGGAQTKGFPDLARKFGVTPSAEQQQ
jgi:hypothetical protein